MTAKSDKAFYIVFLLLSIWAVVLAASKERASAGVVFQGVGFAIAVALLIAGVYALLKWLRPKWLLNFASFTDAQRNQPGGCLAGIVAFLVAMTASKWSFALLEYLLNRHLYGHEAWAGGVRVINNGGRLSNGEELTGFPAITLYMGTFVLTAIFALGAFLLVRYFGFRIRGRRWSDRAE